MHYPLFRSNEVQWCKDLKIVWKKSNRIKGPVGPSAKTTSSNSPNHLEAIHQSEPPHQWQIHSAVIKLQDQAASRAKTRKALLTKPKPLSLSRKNKGCLRALRSSATAIQPVPLVFADHTSSSTSGAVYQDVKRKKSVPIILQHYINVSC